MYDVMFCLDPAAMTDLFANHTCLRPMTPAQYGSKYPNMEGVVPNAMLLAMALGTLCDHVRVCGPSGLCDRIHETN